MIAALYVLPDGQYAGIGGVDVWDEIRDARKYRGPHPVVAHPPCKRWGRFWSGGPSAKVRRMKGDDGGCFAHALWSVRTFGGVIEHPEASHAWAWFGLRRPPRPGGWVAADGFGGWTCCVAQGHYGHSAQKLTWLYVVGCQLPDLTWGLAPGMLRLDAGYHSAEERRRGGGYAGRRLSARENLATPPAFRDLLIGIARTAG